MSDLEEFLSQVEESQTWNSAVDVGYPIVPGAPAASAVSHLFGIDDVNRQAFGGAANGAILRPRGARGQRDEHRRGDPIDELWRGPR